MDKKKKNPLVIPEETLAKIRANRMEMRTVPIETIKPNEYNPNRQSAHEFELLCRSIEEDGFTQPVLVNRGSMTIVDGEHRWRALQAMGYTEIACCFTDMTPEQAMIATLRHNRARGSEDIQRTAEILTDLLDMGAGDWVKDSLMMTDTDYDLLTKSIPKAELHLRTDDMSFEEVQSTLEQERALVNLKQQEEAMMARKDNNKYTLQCTFLSEEAWVVKTVIGRKHAEGILALCKEYQTLQGTTANVQA